MDIVPRNNWKERIEVSLIWQYPRFVNENTALLLTEDDAGNKDSFDDFESCNIFA